MCVAPTSVVAVRPTVTRELVSRGAFWGHFWCCNWSCITSIGDHQDDSTPNLWLRIIDIGVAGGVVVGTHHVHGFLEKRCARLPTISS